jgi:hypothetical protein
MKHETIQHGEFHEDLYYRLNGLVLRLPPLRERSDLTLVAQRILANECPQGAPRIGAEVMALFQRCDWPGNIRQLANVLRTAAVMAAGEPQITQVHLSDDFLEDVRRLAQQQTAVQAAAAQPTVATPGVPQVFVPALGSPLPLEGAAATPFDAAFAPATAVPLSMAAAYGAVARPSEPGAGFARAAPAQRAHGARAGDRHDPGGARRRRRKHLRSFQRRHGRGLTVLAHRDHREEATLTWRTTWVWMSSAMTWMPTSIDKVPVWLMLARKDTSSPTWMGWRNIT